MTRVGWIRPVTACAVLLFGVGAVQPQRDGSLAVLSGIDRGQWQFTDAERNVRKVCVTSPASLLQIVHGGTQCEHFVMDNQPRSATIRYTCPGHGHGRTTLSIETGRLLRIETQGVADGAPFSEEYEGRLLGRCG